MPKERPWPLLRDPSNCDPFPKQDVRLASHAMNTVQGYVLFSSDRGGMRIEYAKNKMGDVNAPQQASSVNSGSPVSTLARRHLVTQLEYRPFQMQQVPCLVSATADGAFGWVTSVQIH